MRPASRLALIAAIALAGPVQAAAPAPDEAGVARCIVGRIPQEAQLFRAADGSMRVVAIGRRGAIARWIVARSAGGLHVVRSGGAAGLDRAVTAGCLPA